MLRGMHAWGSVYPTYAPPPLWTEFLTHACENITFPQLLLRAVKMLVVNVNFVEEVSYMVRGSLCWRCQYLSFRVSVLHFVIILRYRCHDDDNSKD